METLAENAERDVDGSQDCSHGLSGAKPYLDYIANRDSQAAEGLPGASSDPVYVQDDAAPRPGEAGYADGARGSLGLALRGCKRTVLTGTCWGCGEGMAWAKVLVCGREQCPVCGAIRSEAHQRRAARMLSKVQQMASVGYWVVTFPVEERKKLRTKNGLRKAQKQVWSALKAEGYARGIRRWHLFGDPPPSGAYPVYHPHLNCLVDGGWIPLSRIEAVQAAIREALGVPNAVVNYSYAPSVPQIMHLIRYVTRATFLDWHWDPDLVLTFEGFHMVTYCGGPGAWKGPALWELSDGDGKTGRLACLEEAMCPDCGERIRWSRVPVPWDNLARDWTGEEEGGGYVRLTRRARSPGP